jgi:hypothetical protein
MFFTSKKRQSIIQVMNNIFENDEVLVSDIKKKFGEESFKNFSQVCLGGTDSYAIERHDPPKIRLNRRGTNYFMKLMLEEEKRKQSKVSSYSTVAAVIIAFVGFIHTGTTYPENPWLLLLSILALTSLLGIAGILLVAAVSTIFNKELL